MESLNFEGGGGGAASDEESGQKDGEIQDVAEKAVSQWNKDPVKYPELSEYSLFMQLTASRSDMMASYDLLKILNEHISPIKVEGRQESIGAEQRV